MKPFNWSAGLPPNWWNTFTKEWTIHAIKKPIPATQMRTRTAKNDSSSKATFEDSDVSFDLPTSGWDCDVVSGLPIWSLFAFSIAIAMYCLLLWFDLCLHFADILFFVFIQFFGEFWKYAKIKNVKVIMKAKFVCYNRLFEQPFEINQTFGIALTLFLLASQICLFQIIGISFKSSGI